MFDDFEQALAEDSRQRRRYCGFGRWLASLAEEHRATAQSLVDSVGADGEFEYNCRQLARYFQTKGGSFNDQVINRHRNKTCCGQS